MLDLWPVFVEVEPRAVVEIVALQAVVHRPLLAFRRGEREHQFLPQPGLPRLARPHVAPLPAPTPPPPATDKESLKAAEASRLAAEEHRPAGPQAAARPVGKTPMPPAGSGPKKPGDGKSGPKPFVVKPNVGKPLTIKPQMAPPPEPPKPAAAAKKPAAPPAKAAKKPDGKGDRHSSELSKRKPR